MRVLQGSLRIVTAALVLVTIPGMAQSRFDVPLTAGAPTPQGAIFSSADGVSWTGNGEVHTVFGLQLPSAAVHQSMAPAGALGIAGGWTRLDESTALYLSTGGQLVLVRNLPNLPAALTLINTGLSASSAAFIPWTKDRAVLVDATMPGFLVLTHGPSGATLDVVASPVALTAPGSSYEWGSAYNGHFLGHGPGPDGMASTSDDHLIALVESSPGGFTAVPMILPSVAQPEGLVFSERRTPAIWNSNSYVFPTSVACEVTIIKFDGTGSLLGSSTFMVSPFWPAYSSPGPGCLGPCTFMTGDLGDSFRVAFFDDAAVGYSHRFINEAGTAPILSDGYLDDGQLGFHHLVAENEVVADSGPIFTSGPITYTRFIVGGGSQSAQVAGLFQIVDALRPHPGALLLSTDDGSAQVITDLLGADTSTVLAGSGTWLGSWEMLTPGKGAAFFDSTGMFTFGNPPDRLVVVTAPGTQVVGESASFPFSLSVMPTVAQLSTPITVQADTLLSTYAGPTTLFVSSALAAAPLAVDVAPFVPGTVVYISVTDLIFSVPIPMSAGTGQAVLDFSGLPADAAGLSFYLQALFFETTWSTFLISDAFLVVVG